MVGVERITLYIRELYICVPNLIFIHLFPLYSLVSCMLHHVNSTLNLHSFLHHKPILVLGVL